MLIILQSPAGMNRLLAKPRRLHSSSARAPHDDVPLGPVILVQFVLGDLEPLRCIHKTGLLLEAFFRGNCIGISCVNAYQLLIIVVNVPEKVNGFHDCCSLPAQNSRCS
jgi:hypothetical protein